MSRPLTVAVIGAGNIAVRHLANLEFMGNTRVAAICDLDLPRAHALAERYSATAYGDFSSMFAEIAALDAVVLCTPPIVRREVFALAAERGVAIYCEKPPANSLDEARQIARLVDEQRILCSVGFHMRYSPAVDRFRDLIAGRPVNLVQSIMSSPAALVGSLDPWFFIKEKSGGAIMDQANHVIDLLRFVAGDITAVQTFGNNVLCPKGPDFTIEDTTCTNLRFANGGSGSHIHSWAVPRGQTALTLMGGDFALALQAHSPPFVRGIFGAPGGDQQTIDERFPQGPPMGRSGQTHPDRQASDPPDPPHYESLRHFLEAVRQGDASLIRSPFADAVKSLAVVLAMNRSIESAAVEVIA